MTDNTKAVADFYEEKVSDEVLGLLRGYRAEMIDKIGAGEAARILFALSLNIIGSAALDFLATTTRKIEEQELNRFVNFISERAAGSFVRTLNEHMKDGSVKMEVSIGSK